MTYSQLVKNDISYLLTENNIAFSGRFTATPFTNISDFTWFKRGSDIIVIHEESVFYCYKKEYPVCYFFNALGECKTLTHSDFKKFVESAQPFEEWFGKQTLAGIFGRRLQMANTR